MYKFLYGLVLFFFLCLGLGVIGAALPPSNRAQTDRDLCAWRVGIRRDTPLMYETTKALYYGAYVRCMLDCGHPLLPLP